MSSTMAGTEAPSQNTAGSGGPAARRHRWSSPLRLWACLIASMLAVIAVATSSAITVAGRQSTANSDASTTEPLAEYVQELYRSLADANAAAATAILVGPTPPARFGNRYNSDVQSAEQELSFASRIVAGDKDASDDLAVVAADLPVYTGLISTANANNRLGYPVGAAYLREASDLMTNTMLSKVTDVEGREYAAQGATAGRIIGPPLWFILVAILAVLVLAVVWRRMAEMTRRSVNAGLLGGAFALAVLVVWTLAASISAGHAANAAEAQFYQVNAQLSARGDLANAESDEALSLVERGEDDGKYAAATQKDMTQLQSFNEQGAIATDVKTLQGIVGNVQQLTSQGQYSKAVGDVVGFGTNAANTTAVYTATALDDALTAEMNQDQSAYTIDANAAISDLDGGLPVAIVIGLLGAAVAAYGVNRRLGEYR
ncbi:MAG TPA: hypothetical protein VGM10_24170 [Actinocrinis sp.]|jgi:hypothetical protein